MRERWAPVKGTKLYEVSDRGRVRSRAKGAPRLLRPGLASNGYFTVAIGRGNSRTVHSLVAEAFIGPKPKHCDVFHKNGRRTDNRAKNLEYGTRSGNNIQASLQNRRKVSVAAARLIRATPKSAEHARLWAELLGISTSYVFGIWYRALWRHLD